MKPVILLKTDGTTDNCDAFFENFKEYMKNELDENVIAIIRNQAKDIIKEKVLLDEIFERDNYVNTISVTMKNVAGASGGGEDKRFKKNIEYILVYAKDYNCLKQFSEVCDYIEMPEIIEMYKQEKKSWKYTSVLINPGEKEYIGSTVDGSGDEI